jgi:hypothetical protein
LLAHLPSDHPAGQRHDVANRSLTDLEVKAAYACPPAHGHVALAEKADDAAREGCGHLPVNCDVCLTSFRNRPTRNQLALRDPAPWRRGAGMVRATFKLGSQNSRLPHLPGGFRCRMPRQAAIRRRLSGAARAQAL